MLLSSRSIIQYKPCMVIIMVIIVVHIMDACMVITITTTMVIAMVLSCLLSWFYHGFTRMHARTPRVFRSHSHMYSTKKKSPQKAKNLREFQRRQV